MDIEFDSEKDATNIAKHRISLTRAVDLEMFAIKPDDRYEYGEQRYRAWGLIDGRPYCLAFATRNGRVRAISLRRAHKKEIDRHAPQDQGI